MLTTSISSCALVSCKYRMLPECPVRYHGMALPRILAKTDPNPTLLASRTNRSSSIRMACHTNRHFKIIYSKIYVYHNAIKHPVLVISCSLFFVINGFIILVKWKEIMSWCLLKCCFVVLLDGQHLFSKKFAETSQFVVSSRIWSRTIPTENCDVLVTFPSTIEDNVLMWVLARLRARVPELSVHARHHSSTGIYGFYLTASFEKYVVHC